MLLRTEKVSSKRTRYIIAFPYRHFALRMEMCEAIREAFCFRRLGTTPSFNMPYPELMARYRQAITDFAASDKPRLP